MQNLFSKSRRIRNRYCKICASLSRLGRRYSTARLAAAQIPTRAATQAQSFTALYTSLFATVAIIDAKRKGEQRRDIDLQISETKDAVAKLRLENDAAGLVEDSRGVATAYRIALDMDVPKKDSLWDRYGDVPWAALALPQASRYLKKCDEWGVAAQLRANDGFPYPANNVGSVEYHVRRLVRRLLSTLGGKVGVYDEENPVREAINRLLDLNYPQYQRGETLPATNTQLTARQRVETLKAVLAWDNVADDLRSLSDNRASRRQVVEHVCYHLLTATSAPIYHTYIIMASSLHHSQDQNLVRELMAYAKLASRRGAHNEGAFPWEYQLAAISLERRDRKGGNMAGIIRDTLAMTKSMDQTRSAVLFEGVLQLLVQSSRLREAAQIISSVPCSTFNIDIITRILAWAIYRLDMTAALDLLKSFVDLDDNLEFWLYNLSSRASTMLIYQLQHLLDICGLWQKPSQLGDALNKHGIDCGQFAKFRARLERLKIANALARSEKLLTAVSDVLRGHLPWIGVEAFSREHDGRMFFSLPYSWLKLGELKHMWRNARVPVTWRGGGSGGDNDGGEMVVDLRDALNDPGFQEMARWTLRVTSLAFQVRKQAAKAAYLTVQLAQLLEEAEKNMVLVPQVEQPVMVPQLEQPVPLGVENDQGAEGPWKRVWKGILDLDDPMGMPPVAMPAIQFETTWPRGCDARSLDELVFS